MGLRMRGGGRRIFGGSGGDVGLGVSGGVCVEGEVGKGRLGLCEEGSGYICLIKRPIVHYCGGRGDA